MKTLRTPRALLASFLLVILSAAPLRAQLVWTGGGSSAAVFDDHTYLDVTDSVNWDDTTLVGDGTENVEFGTASQSYPFVYVPFPDGVIALHNITFSNSEYPTYEFHGDGDASTIYLASQGGLTAYADTSANFHSDLGILLSSGQHTADIGSNSTIQIESNISEESAANITKTGSGTLALTGDNTFTGGVTLNDGWLLVGHNNALGLGTLTLNYGTLSPIYTESEEPITFTLANTVQITAGIKLGDCDTYNGITFSGTISGTGAFDAHGYGDITFSGNNSDWTGGISFYGANHVYVGHANALGTGPVHFDYSSDTLLQINPGIAAAIGSLSGGDYEYDSEIALGNGASLAINQADSGTFDGYISGYHDGTTDGGLIKNGSGTLTLSGGASYYGPTVINAGTLVADGDHSSRQLGYGAVTINAGTLELKGTTLLNSAVSVESGAKITGYGSIGNGFDSSSQTTVKSGGILSPGVAGCEPIGQLAFDHLVLQSGAIYEWNLQDPNGCAGSGWDLVSITEYTSTLHIDSTTGSKLTINISSLDESGGVGAATGFVFQPYSWKIFDGGSVPIQYASGSFDPNLFNLVTTGFTTDFGTGTGIFSLSADEYSIYLNFTPVPEPSTYALLALGLAGAGLATWRKRQGT